MTEDACEPIILISKALWYCGYFAGIIQWDDWGIRERNRSLGNSKTNPADVSQPTQPVSNHLHIFLDPILTPRKEVLTLEDLCILSLLDCSYWIGKTPVVQLSKLNHLPLVPSAISSSRRNKSQCHASRNCRKQFSCLVPGHGRGEGMEISQKST